MTALRSVRVRPLVVAVLVVAAAVAVEPALSPSLRATGASVFMLAVLAQSWNVLGGLAGYVSFGQVVFFAAGAFGSALLMTRAQLPFWCALPLGAVAAGGTGVLLGPLLLRLRGQYFALATLVLAGAAASVAGLLLRRHGAPSGLALRPVPPGGLPHPGPAGFYWAYLALAAAAVVAVAGARRSRFGRALAVLRDNEDTAVESGIPVMRVKVAAFALSALLAGAAGAVFCLQRATLTQAGAFGSGLTVLPVAIVVLGGLGRVAGPLASAVILGVVSSLLDRYAPSAHTLVIGLLLTAAALADPLRLPGRARPTATRPEPDSASPATSISPLTPTPASASASPSSPAATSTSSPVSAPASTEVLTRSGTVGAGESSAGGIESGGDGLTPGSPAGSEPAGGKLPADGAGADRAAAARARPLLGPVRPAGPGAGAALELTGVTVRFGGVRALRSVTLRIRPGQIIGLLGPNGAGKSTLLDAIGGWLCPVEGRIRLDGQDVTGASPWRIARAGVARTHQVPAPLWGLTVGENVAAGVLPRCRSARAARARVDTALGWAGLLERRHDLPGTLGVAGLRRLELARAAATRPRLLLADEPLAGAGEQDGDMAALVQMIMDIRAAGTTVLLAEHTMAAVLQLCDVVLVLQHGEPLAAGPPHTVLSQPQVIGAYLGQHGNLRSLA